MELDALNEEIENEIRHCEVQMRDAVSEVMESEAVRVGAETLNGNDLFKLRNRINISFISASSLERDRLSG